TKRIHLLAMFPEAVAYMRTGSQTCTSHVANHIALLYHLALAHALGKFAHMQILGGVGGVVADFYIVAISAGVGSSYHFTGSGSHNRSAMWSGIVRAQVGFHPL